MSVRRSGRLRSWALLYSILLLGAALPASAQWFSVGVKAGVPLASAFSTGQTGHATADAYDRLYIIGPTAEIRLPFHLALEVNALYRRNGFTYYTSGFGIGTPFFVPPSVSRTRLNDWQLPFLAKYEVRGGLVRPFVDAGVVYRHLSVVQTVLLQPDHPNTTGFAAGGGLSLKLLLLRLSPEIRYTHWFTPPFQNGNLVVQSTTNQADFLLGLSF